MREKEIAEIRRRLYPDRHSITHIYGCYVNEDSEIITTFAQSLGLMPQEESEKYLALFKRSLSGTLNKNLLDITFATQQVADSDEHRLLMDLRRSELKDDETRRIFYEKVMNTHPLEGNYLILLLHNRYDVPFRHKDGTVMEDVSDNTFSYIQCALCPVKQSKAALAYQAAESEFHNSSPNWVVAPPEIGFLFPAFDERATNIYNALFYTHSAEDNHEAFVDAVFHTEIPMPAAAQKETFGAVLSGALGDECTLEAVKGVQEQMLQMIQLHKESKDPDPLVVSADQVKSMLENSGVPAEVSDKFQEKFAQDFSEQTDLSPKNIIDTRKLEVVTPDVVIRVAPDKGHLIETRVLGGVKYLVIRADESVEVNGIVVNIPDEA